MKVAHFYVLYQVASAGWSFGYCEPQNMLCLKIKRAQKLGILPTPLHLLGDFIKPVLPEQQSGAIKSQRLCSHFKVILIQKAA